MPYIINTYNGTQIAVVNDGTVDNTTDIKLVGKNYAGFGEIINENFVYLLESFAGAVQPPRPVAGQVWYDSANRVIKFYDGSRFRIAGGAEIGPNQPVGLARGDLWWETDGEQLYVYNGEDFILVGPVASGGEGVSQLTSAVVKDISANNRTILKVTINDEVVSVVSKDEFTLDSNQNPIPGYSAIKKGFNLGSEATFPNIRYWGTAEAADSLRVSSVNIPSSSFVRRDEVEQFDKVVKFKDDNGIEIGVGQDLKLHITSGDNGNVTNQIGSILNFRVNTGTGAVIVGKFSGNAFIPDSNGTGTIGSVTNKWGTMYANNYVCDALGVFSGDLTGNVTGNVTGDLTGNVTGNVTATTGTSTLNNLTVTGTLTANVTGTSATAEKLVVDAGTARTATTTLVNNSIVARDASGNINFNIGNGTATNSQALNGAAASTTATSGTIAQRDSNKDLTARKFLGTATAAQFADLAEIYASDEPYEPGTVLVIGGEAEVTQSTTYMDHNLVGIVSTDPAFLMNKDAEGVAVALRGRVPCKVEGPVKKGDILVTGDQPGVAVAVDPEQPILNSLYIVGRSLENNDNPEVKLVEVLV